MSGHESPDVDSDGLTRLAAQIGAGDVDAEAKFVERYSRWVQAMLLKRCRNVEQAQDLTQQALLTVILRLRERRLDDPRKLDRFVHRAAINLYRNEYRRDSRRRTFADAEKVETAPSPGPTLFDEIASEQAISEVVKLMDSLPTQRDRELLYRFYVLDHDKSDICSDLDLSSVHFNRVLHRARNRFRKILSGSETFGGLEPTGGHNV